MAGPTRAGLRTLVASAPATRTWRVGLEPKHEDADLGTLIDELLERLEPEPAERVQVEISSGADLTGCWIRICWTA